MEGLVYRVTYNVNKNVAELHMKDGTIKEIPLKNEEWEKVFCGNVMENLKKLLDE